jgi:hypothetical protein
MANKNIYCAPLFLTHGKQAQLTKSPRPIGTIRPTFTPTAGDRQSHDWTVQIRWQNDIYTTPSAPKPYSPSTWLLPPHIGMPPPFPLRHVVALLLSIPAPIFPPSHHDDGGRWPDTLLHGALGCGWRPGALSLHSNRPAGGEARSAWGGLRMGFLAAEATRGRGSQWWRRWPKDGSAHVGPSSRFALSPLSLWHLPPSISDRWRR